MKKKEVFENCLMICVLITLIVIIKLTIGNGAQKSNFEESQNDSLQTQALAMKIDSLKEEIEKYHINDPHLNLELDADYKEFCEYFEQNSSTDSIEKLTILATRGKNNKLHWHIKVKHQ